MATLQNQNNGQKPIFISFHKADQIDEEILFCQIETVLQSDETFLALGPQHLRITIIELFEGKGHFQNPIATPAVVM